MFAALIASMIGLIITTPTFASLSDGYELKLKLSLDGKHVLSPRIIVGEGEMARVTEEGNGLKTFVEVIATESPEGKKRAIHMAFVVGTIAKDGTKKIISRPKIIALENAEAALTVSNSNGKKDMTLSVVATRKVL